MISPLHTFHSHQVQHCLDKQERIVLSLSYLLSLRLFFMLKVVGFVMKLVLALTL